MFVPVLKSWLKKWTTSIKPYSETTPDWIIKSWEKKPVSPIVNPNSDLEVNKNFFISVPYVPGFNEEFRRFF